MSAPTMKMMSLSLLWGLIGWGGSAALAGERTHENVAVVIRKHGDASLTRSSRVTAVELLTRLNEGDRLKVAAGGDVTLSRASTGERYAFAGPCELTLSADGLAVGRSVAPLPPRPARAVAEVSRQLDLKGFNGGSARAVLAKTTCSDRAALRFDHPLDRGETLMLSVDGVLPASEIKARPVQDWNRKRWELDFSGRPQPSPGHIYTVYLGNAPDKGADDTSIKPEPLIFVVLSQAELDSLKPLQKAISGGDAAAKLELFNAERRLHLFDRAEALLAEWNQERWLTSQLPRLRQELGNERSNANQALRKS